MVVGNDGDDGGDSRMTTMVVVTVKMDMSILLAMAMVTKTMVVVIEATLLLWGQRQGRQ
jgi:hypothetical protein